MDHDNIFDEAMAAADENIIMMMGIVVTFTIGLVRQPDIRGVFDEPGLDVVWGKEAAKIRNTAPTLFVFASDVAGLQVHDSVLINGETFRVTDPGWDELSGRPGSTVTVTLARGAPGNNTPEVLSPSPQQWRK